ncbi:MAG: hypothetical protein Q4D60_01700 [Eubacteriales bacterium]|nr:hypothetical protein [Eubacteriales bacterium]
MNKADKFDRRIKIFFFLSCAMLFVFFLYGRICLPQRNLFSVEKAKPYEGEWVQIGKDGSRAEKKPPCRLEGERGEEVVVETVLPESLTDNTVMSFYSLYQEMHFYVGGEHRFSYEKEKKAFFSEYPVRGFIPLFLSEEDGGKTLRIKITGWGGHDAGKFYDVYMGTMDQVILRVAGNHIGKVVMTFVFLVIFSLTGVATIVFGNMIHRRLSMVWLCVGICLLMVWTLADSYMRQFFPVNDTVLVSIAYLVVMLVPIAFCLYLDGIQRQRYHGIYRKLEMASALAFVVFFSLNLLGVDFIEMSSWVYYFLLGAIAVFGINLIRDLVNRHIKEYRYVAAGMIMTFFCGMIEIFLLLGHINKMRQIGLFSSQLFFLLMACVQTITDVRRSMELESEKAKEADQAREELTSALSEELLPLMKELNREVRQLHLEIGREKSEKLEMEMETVISFFTSIRDLSGFQKNAEYGEKDWYETESFMESVESFLKIRTKAKGLDYELVVDDALPRRLYGNMECYKYIFVNLVEYAVQHTKEGYVVCSIGAERKEGKLCAKLSVASTGSGLTRALADRLENMEEEMFRGGDIRLFSVRQMVRRQEGILEIETMEEEGFLITVLLPYASAEGEDRELVYAASMWEEDGENVSQGEKEQEEEPPTESLPEEKEEERQIDADVGIVYCGGNEEMYLEILEAYIKTGKESKEKLRSFVEKEDWENYRILIHSIKSTSLNIGAKKLSEKAKAQEKAAKEGRWEDILVGFEELMQLYHRVLWEAEELLPKEWLEKMEEEEEDGLSKVAAYLNDYEIEAALEEIQVLREKGLVEEEKLDKIQEALEDFDYEEAQRLLDQH